MKLFIMLLFSTMTFATTVTSCNKGNNKGNVDKQISETDMKNVQYGQDSAQKMDMYLPAGRDTENTKVIVFIHGGSWSSGDKTEFNDAINAIRDKLSSYAIFNINYRLAYHGHNKFPAQLDDIQAALKYIESNAAEYKINPSKIALVGASAGAHLALLQAYKYNTNGKIKAVVDLFGPADLTTLYNNHPVPQASQPVLVNFLGSSPATNSTLYQQASPVNFITAKTVPTLILHGSADYIVPPAQSNALKAKLQANNVKVEMKTYAGEGHGWYGSNLVDTYSKVISFIKENVH